MDNADGNDSPKDSDNLRSNRPTQTVKQSGWRPCLSSAGGWTECAQRTMLEDIQIQECPHDDDLDIQPQTDMIRRMGDRVPAKKTVSPYTPMPVPPADLS